MNFSVTILGSGAATPTLGRHCSSQIVNINGFKILLDCGEATQNQMRAYHQRLLSFDTIFISHLHGDHWFGLPGLISSFHLCGRSEPLDIFAPEGLKPVIESILQISGSGLQYELRIHEIKCEQPSTIFQNKMCSVKAFPLLHSVPTYGFIFEENQPLLNLKKDARRQYNLTDIECQKLKQGQDLVRDDGSILPYSELTLPRKTSRRYAYCCDTGYFESIADIVRGVDLLCLESTFDLSLQSLADERQHLTASQAAQIAADAQVKQLLLTHFSARYKQIDTLANESQAIFKNVILADDGKTYEITST